MAWQDEMVPLLRHLVDDADETLYRFTDERLEGALVASARLVQMDVEFDVNYLANVATTTISPDPTTSSPRDENFINLVCVRAACLTDMGSAAKAADKAIRVSDAGAEVDLREAWKAKVSLLKQGWCSVYKEMKDEFYYAQRATVGAAIMTPFRTMATSGGRR